MEWGKISVKKTITKASPTLFSLFPFRSIQVSLLHYPKAILPILDLSSKSLASHGKRFL